MKRHSGFSLMEMMVVLTIISVVAAASVPIIRNATTPRNARSAECLWRQENGITFYNEGGNTVAINTDNRTANQEILSIHARNSARPHIALTNDDATNNPPMYISKRNSSIGILPRVMDNVSNALGIGNISNDTLRNNSIAIGNGTSARFVNSIAIGTNATADNQNAVAIGTGSNARSSALAIGENASASAVSAIALGTNSLVSKSGSIAIGSSSDTDFITSVSSPYSIALGYNAQIGSQSNYSLAVGNGTSVNGKHGIAIGTFTNHSSSSENSIALGHDIKNSAKNSVVIGTASDEDSPIDVSGENAVVLGNDNNVSGNQAVALGHNLTVSGKNAIAIAPIYDDEEASSAIGENSIVIGFNSTATGGSIVIGNNSSTAEDVENSIVIGNNIECTESNQIVIAGEYLHAPGCFVLLGNIYSTSDIRLKNILGKSKAGLDKVKELVAYNYTYKKDKSNTPQVGVIAQDLEKIFPNAILKMGEDKIMHIRKSDMFYALLNSIKELDSKINSFFDVEILALKTEIEELEAKNNNVIQKNNEALERIKELEKRI